MSASTPKGRMRTQPRNKYNFTEGLIKRESVCLYFLIPRYFIQLSQYQDKIILESIFHEIYLFKLLNFAKFFNLPPSRVLLASFIFDNRPWPLLPLPERRSVIDSVFRKLVRWPQWVLEHPQCTGFVRRSCFGVVGVMGFPSTPHLPPTDKEKLPQYKESGGYSRGWWLVISRASTTKKERAATSYSGSQYRA